MNKSIKILLGDSNEGLDCCDIVLTLDEYRLVDLRENLIDNLTMLYGFDETLAPAYAQRLLDTLSDYDLKKYLKRVYKTLPDKTFIHTNNLQFAKVVKEALSADLIRVALYGINPVIPLRDSSYDSIIADASRINRSLVLA